ncbi:MAG TPA: alpha-glucan family phosphorylase [Gemmatimonadaceae bacterium]|jgi:starch phosphorylase
MAEFENETIAYFSMEICLEPHIPTYSGGLGILAGDTLRSAADLELPMTAVSLAHRKGYFRQHLDPNGQQTESPENWCPENILEGADTRVTVEIEGRTVHVRAWRYPVQGATGHIVPVYLLDTDVPENSEWDRTLTDVLYGGDARYRLAQEIVLGMGGAALLQALGMDAGVHYHINEGHAALLTLTLLDRQLGSRPPWEAAETDLESVRRQCVFTTHTPVPAGHDTFPESQVARALGERTVALLSATRCCDDDGSLNMTYLALRLSRYINGVALRHREVSRGMFPAHAIDAVTNGVHAPTWTSQPFQTLFDRHVPEWRRDNLYLRYAIGIPVTEIREAHAKAKREMIAEVERRTGVHLDAGAMTVGFARRATPYKRADMIFSDPDRLRAIVHSTGPLQIVYGGKAHPNDEGGKALIRHIVEESHALEGAVKVVYLENYEMDLAFKLTSGVDVWLNNPRKPLEASGTSGMKAALNGVPSLSVLDGWWIEGHIEGVTGWSIGGSTGVAPDDAAEANDLYVKLEHVVLPLFYGLPLAFAEVMRHAIALNGSFFNTQRMVGQYVRNAYFPTYDESTPEHASVPVRL